jgi:hypothetical protein
MTTKYLSVRKAVALVKEHKSASARDAAIERQRNATLALVDLWIRPLAELIHDKHDAPGDRADALELSRIWLAPLLDVLPAQVADAVRVRP